jgi:hypothetical protein
MIQGIASVSFAIRNLLAIKSLKEHKKRGSKVVETKWAQKELILTIIRIERNLKLNLVTRT